MKSALALLRVQDEVGEGVGIQVPPQQGPLGKHGSTPAHINNDHGFLVEGGDVLTLRAAVPDVFQDPVFIPAPVDQSAFVQVAGDEEGILGMRSIRMQTRHHRPGVVFGRKFVEMAGRGNPRGGKSKKILLKNAFPHQIS